MQINYFLQQFVAPGGRAEGMMEEGEKGLVAAVAVKMGAKGVSTIYFRSFFGAKNNTITTIATITEVLKVFGAAFPLRMD